MKKKLVCVLFCACSAFVVLAGCGKGNVQNQENMVESESAGEESEASSLTAVTSSDSVDEEAVQIEETLEEEQEVDVIADAIADSWIKSIDVLTFTDYSQIAELYGESEDHSYIYEDSTYGPYGFAFSDTHGVTSVALDFFRYNAENMRRQKQDYYDQYAITSDLLTEYCNESFTGFYNDAGLDKMNYKEIQELFGNKGVIVKLSKDVPGAQHFYVMVEWYVSDINKTFVVYFDRNGNVTKGKYGSFQFWEVK
ncbi:MAG: hypothetical protein MJ105_05900 [Lachnospiraceae bacterium]|nr:hypothetical protein [Lachnospiraceae bacterium]